MRAFKAKIKLKELKSIIDVPKDIISNEVEIIILSENNSRKALPLKKKMKKFGGVFKKYANSDLIENEKDNAWTNISEDKHGLL
jgi:hypothetical protein